MPREESFLQEAMSMLSTASTALKSITFYLYSTQKPLSFRFVERNRAAFVCECVSMIIHIIIDEGLIRVPACQR